MFLVDIMTWFGPMCVVTSAIARFIPIFNLAYFLNTKTYTGEILIWRHIDGVVSEKPQNTHNLTSLYFNGCLGWKFKNCWNDCSTSFNYLTNRLYSSIRKTLININGLYVNQCQTSGNYLILRGIWQILEMNILPLKVLTTNKMPSTSKKIDILVLTLPKLDKTCKS